jgi:DNA-binding MarR family transcriptional regulator
MTTSPIRPDVAHEPGAQESVATIEREVTLLLRRTLEEVWAQGYGAGTAVNRYSYPLLVRLEQSGPLRLGQLAELLGVSKPTVSRQVTRLVAAALVLVAEDPDDSRSGLVTLTRAGRAQVQEVRARRTAPLREVLTGWDERDRARFAELLAGFNRGLDARGT